MAKFNLCKKILTVSLAAVMAGSFVFGASAASLTYGDVNGDASIDSIDALAVLNHSVGKVQYTGDAFKKADVNGDGSIDATDALLVLNYAVGKIDRFPADKVDIEVPSTAGEVLALYASAVDDARAAKPAYRKDITCESKLEDVSFKLGPLTALMIKQSDLETLEADLRAETDGTESNYVIAKQQSSTSLNNLPVKFTETNASLFKSVSATLNADNNYLVTIAFKDTINPKATDPTVTCLGLASYDEAKKAVEESTQDIENGEMMSTELSQLKYSNAKIVCEIDPETNEIVSLSVSYTSLVNTKMTVLDMTVTTSASMTENEVYSGFAY